MWWVSSDLIVYSPKLQCMRGWCWQCWHPHTLVSLQTFITTPAKVAPLKAVGWRDAADTATGNTNTCCCGGGQREKSITCCSLILNDTMQWCMTIRFRIKIFQCHRQCHGLLCELILYSITYLFIPSCHYMFCVWVRRGRRRLHLHWRQWKLQISLMCSCVVCCVSLGSFLFPRKTNRINGVTQ